jgi:hypothetical protein
MKLYLLRVGADSTPVGGGFHSRICKDRSFTFIPILAKDGYGREEYLNKSKALTYRDFKWRNNSIDPHIPDKISRDQFIHNDPEFVTFTYGSPKYNLERTRKDKNYKGLLNMKKDDILVFYAAFSSDSADMDGLYFFAYFIVDRTIDWPGNLSQEQQALVRNNHHFIHKRPEDQFVVVVGKRDESKVFEKAILLSSHYDGREMSNYKPCRIIKEKLNYDKSMNLSSLRKPPGEEVAGSFKEYLDSHCT